MAPPIVVNKHKFVYYPIPKVACTSLKQFCADLLGKKYTNIHLVGFPSKGEKNYLRFVFVRNPWDRLISCFLNKMKENTRSKDSPSDVFINGIWQGFSCYAEKYGFNSGMSFTQFVEAVHRIPDDRAEEHFKSQYIQFPASAKNLHIYHFETIAEDFAEMCNLIGVKYDLLHTMKTDGRKTYRHYYTAQTQQLVAERYATDIERFGYGY